MEVVGGWLVGWKVPGEQKRGEAAKREKEV